MTEPVLLEERSGGVLLVTLNRPHRMNALDSVLRAELTALWKRCRSDDETKVIILTGAGDRAFCTGRDLKETADAYASQDPLEYEATSEYGYPQLQRIGKPLIAAIHGYCLAGGLVVALGCDIRLCTVSAKFGNPQVQRGRGTQSLLRLVRAGIPKAVAMDMVLTGEPIDAARAHGIGLVSRVYQTKEGLLEGAFAVAGRILQGSERVVRGIKAASETGLVDLPPNLAQPLWEDVTRMMGDDETTVQRTLEFARGDHDA